MESKKLIGLSVFGYLCDKNCKPRWTSGKGSFKGWKLKLCKEHQIVHEMKKEGTK